MPIQQHPSFTIPNSVGQAKPLQAVESGDEYMDFQQAKGTYQRLIDGWNEVVTNTQRNRELRYQRNVESASLRAQGILKPDELYNPVRIIDTNIRREQPQYINYLTQSRRSIIFASEMEETVDGLEKLEADFTKKARYLGWEIPFIRCIDGAQTHGWDSVELVFSEQYPGNFCFHHVGHENLIFAYDSEDINFQEIVIRREQLSSSQLESLVKTKGWKEEEVNNIINLAKKNNSNAAEDEVNCYVYKTFFKKNGVIQVTWMNPTACNDYLVAPRPLFLGVRDTTVAPILEEGMSQPDYPKVFETEFPFTIYKYIESEDPMITSLKGRAAFDEAVQESVSAISSGMINGILRASNVYASPSPSNLNPNPNAAPKALDIVLKNGGLYDTALNFWHPAYPDMSVVQMMQAVVSQNQQEQNKIDYAATNRKDSGKTATEIQAVTKQSAELSSVQIILISIFIRQAYAKAWRIYQSRVLQTKIDVSEILLPLFGDFQRELAESVMPTESFVGGGAIPIVQPPAIPVILAMPKRYIIKSSGDVDVVQRAENLQRKMQAWPVIMNTPIAMEFLKDILRSAFPEDAERYIKALVEAQMQAEAQAKAMLAQVSNVLKATVTGPDGNIKPEYAEQAQQFEQLAANVQSVLGEQSSTSQQQPQ
jgi:hypothetical protein